MFSEIKKVWCDTTTFEGKYVAKDVMKAVSFLVGILLISASAVGVAFGKPITMDAGQFLLFYSLGVQGVKEFAKYKNNVLAADTNTPPTDDNEPPKATTESSDDGEVPDTILTSQQLKDKYAELKSKVD